MPHPYFLMSLLYLSLVALAALASILTGLEIIPLFGSLKWLRVHLVTLGALSEIIFGLAPTLVATARRLPRPKIRWDTWLFLNAGLVLLLIGIPTITRSLIVTGGTLIGVAVTLLIKQLIDLRPVQAACYIHQTAWFTGDNRIYATGNNIPDLVFHHRTAYFGIGHRESPAKTTAGFFFIQRDEFQTFDSIKQSLRFGHADFTGDIGGVISAIPARELEEEGISAGTLWSIPAPGRRLQRLKRLYLSTNRAFGG